MLFLPKPSTQRSTLVGNSDRWAPKNGTPHTDLLANGRIEIMAGSGLNAANIKTIKEAGVDAAQFSIHKKQNRMVSLNMGAQYEVDEEKVLKIRNALK